VKISSPSGDLEILTKDASVEGDFVVLKAELGVWQPKIYLSAGDLWLLASIFLSPPVLQFLLKLPFRFLFRRKKNYKS